MKHLFKIYLLTLMLILPAEVLAGISGSKPEGFSIGTEGLLPTLDADLIISNVAPVSVDIDPGTGDFTKIFDDGYLLNFKYRGSNWIAGVYLLDLDFSHESLSALPLATQTFLEEQYTLLEEQVSGLASGFNSSLLSLLFGSVDPSLLFPATAPTFNNVLSVTTDSTIAQNKFYAGYTYFSDTVTLDAMVGVSILDVSFANDLKLSGTSLVIPVDVEEEWEIPYLALDTQYNFTKQWAAYLFFEKGFSSESYFLKKFGVAWKGSKHWDVKAGYSTTYYNLDNIEALGLNSFKFKGELTGPFASLDYYF